MSNNFDIASYIIQFTILAKILLKNIIFYISFIYISF